MQACLTQWPSPRPRKQGIAPKSQQPKQIRVSGHLTVTGDGRADPPAAEEGPQQGCERWDLSGSARGPRQDQGWEEGARGGALPLTCSSLAGDSATPPRAGTQSCFYLGLEEGERKAAVARLPPGGSRLTSLHRTKVPAPCPPLQTLYKCPVIPSTCQIQFILGNFRDTSDLVNRLEFYSSYTICSVTGHGP